MLYYDRLGLLRPAARSAAGYRVYDAADVARLATICRLRRAGLPLAEIGRALDSATPQLVAALAVRLAELGDQIEVLRGHQRTILTALATGREGDRTWSLDKASLVGLLDAAGIGPDQQPAWHAAAEQADGDLHQRLLESLDLPSDEVARIRGLGTGVVGTVGDTAGDTVGDGASGTVRHAQHPGGGRSTHGVSRADTIADDGVVLTGRMDGDMVPNDMVPNDMAGS